MKIGSLLTIAIVSLSAVGGGLSLYIASTKYETMDKISTAQGRLEVVRAVGDIPRYLNPERGFSINILFGPAVVDPKQRAELDKYRKNTDGAVEKMERIRNTAVARPDDPAEIAAKADAIKTQLTALRSSIDKAIESPADIRHDFAK